MSIKSLKIKNQSYYYWNDIIYIDDFDIKYLKINKRDRYLLHRIRITKTRIYYK